MRTRYSNLTKLQVEGLRETLDFLDNGYKEKSSGHLGNVYYFLLEHRRNGSRIRVYLYSSSIIFKKDGQIIKQVHRRRDGKYYTVLILPNQSLSVSGIEFSECQKLISSSVSFNPDEE